MRIGYGRVSTRDQDADAQRDALAGAGCDQVFIETASGKLARRPELDRALLVARSGDEVVVTKLDRLGRVGARNCVGGDLTRRFGIRLSVHRNGLI